MKALRKISDKQSCIIAEHLCPDFSVFDERFPVCICDACRRGLSNLTKNMKTSLKAFPEYTKLVVAKSTRSDKVCPCYICITGREKGISGKLWCLNTVIFLFLLKILCYWSFSQSYI